MDSLQNCLITDQPIQDYKEIVGGFEYSVLCNGKVFRLKFANAQNWNEILAGDKKFILKAMLYNDEFPIDPVAIITPQLVQKVVSYANYPRLDNFELQKEKFLEWCYKKGGDRYIRLKFDPNEYLVAYTRNAEEMLGLYKALLSEGFILESEGGTLFELTSKGREEAKRVIAKRPQKIKYLFPESPRVYVCYVEKDKILAEKFCQELGDSHLSLMFRNNGLKEDNNVAFSEVNMARQYIVKGNEEKAVDYVIFIQSQQSDNNKSFGSILDISVEEHLKRGVSEYPEFINIACIDDSQLESRPRYHEYYNHFFDLRLLNHKDRCINVISLDWLNRINKESENSKIVTKENCLEWIVKEFNKRNSNPLYIYYSSINYRIESRELMEDLFDQLVKDEAIFLEKFPGGIGDDKIGYKVTLKNKGLNLLEEWKQNENEGFEYDFPILKELSKDEKIWLEAIYQKFLNKENIDLKALRFELDDKLSKDFEPYKEIDNKLASSATQITLYGIWHIHPESDIFGKTDKVIKAIKEIIGLHPGINDITSEMILEKVPEITFDELIRIKDFMYNFNGKLLNGTGIVAGKKAEDAFKITISTHEIYETYRTYGGLHDFICNFYKIKEQSPKVQNDNAPTLNTSAAFQSKTKPILRIENGIDAVLNVKEIATEIGELIRLMSSEKGMMVGVLGRWGRGKTIFLKELWNYLSTIKYNHQDVFIKVEFPAWKYQYTPASWAYLYEILADKYYDKPTKFSIVGYIKYRRKVLKLNYQRFGLLPMVERLGSFLIAAIVSLGLVKWNSISALIGIPLVGSAWMAFVKYVNKQYSTETNDLIKKYGLKHNYKPTMGLQAEIQRETIDLLKTWIPLKKKKLRDESINQRKIVLFVEDIDRCSEDKIVENIDALRVMLDDEEVAKRLIIVTAIDKDILERAIKTKYSKFVKSDFSNEIAKKKLIRITGEYMDKLFISAIRLGSLDASQRDDVFIAMIKEDMNYKNFTPFVDINNKMEDAKGIKDSPVLQKETAIPQNILHPFATENVEIETINTLPNNDILTSDIPNKEENQKNILPEFEKLSPDELNILRRCISKWEGATPRRLRIFYYRYLLSKNLLLNRYSTTGKENIWQKSTHTLYLANQIIEYSKNYSAAKITKKKNEAISTQNVQPDSNEAPPISLSDYIELMKVLEIVIAY